MFRRTPLSLRLLACIALLLAGSRPLARAGGPASTAKRQWEDEVVYVAITEKLWDGDPKNDFMRNAYIASRARLEGGFWGGDLKGATEKLPAIADLGVTTILLYPVMQNDETPVGRFLPTGYRPKDYDRVDRNFGDESDLRSFIRAAHDRDIRVLLDMPLGFPGFEHPFLSDHSKRDWFGEVTPYGQRRWKAENPAVADYLISVCKRWLTRSNCDGFRLDAAQLQPVAFWKRFVKEIRSAADRPLTMVAELPLNPRDIGRIVSECGFDGAYDFSTGKVRDVFGSDASIGDLSFVNAEAERFYRAPRSMMAQIDNYEDAFVTASKEPASARFRIALAYLLTIDRVPLLYPGDELGIAFQEVGGAFPPNRDQSPQLKELKALVALRRREPALRRGEFHEVLSRAGTYGFSRSLGRDQFIVLINASARAQLLAPAVGPRAWRDVRLEDALRGGIVKEAGDGAALNIAGWDYRVLQVR
jgi:alpha-amylase